VDNLELPFTVRVLLFFVDLKIVNETALQIQISQKTHYSARKQLKMMYLATIFS